MMVGYKFSSLLSLMFHALLLGLLLVSVVWTVNPPLSMPLVTEPVRIVDAVTVDQAQVENAIEHLKQQEKSQKQAEAAAAQKLKAQAEAAKTARLQEQKKLTELKQQQLKAAAELKVKEQAAADNLAQLKAQQLAQEQIAAEKVSQLKSQQQAEEKRLSELEQQTLQTKKKQAEEQKRLAALEQKRNDELKQADLKLKQQAEQRMQQAMLAEQQQLSQAQQRQWQTQIEKYTALIAHAVGKQWLVPEGVQDDISCVLLIRLAPNGEVLDVKLARSSGDALLDRSASSAVYKASPLPVPSEPELFDKFREIRLLVRPQGYLS